MGNYSAVLHVNTNGLLKTGGVDGVVHYSAYSASRELLRPADSTHLSRNATPVDVLVAVSV